MAQTKNLSDSVQAVADHGAQHWVGDYFGESGALTRSRQTLSDIRKMRPMIWLSSLEIEEMEFKAVMQMMSTIFGAICHCVARIVERKWNNKFLYAAQAVALSNELYGLVTFLETNKRIHSNLEPGERDVLIACLIFCSKFSWVYPRFGLGKIAKELILVQVKTLPENHVSSLFAKARGAREGIFFHLFSKSVRKAFKREVVRAAFKRAPGFDGSTLSWEDVARLSKLIGDERRQRFAVSMSE